MSIIKSPMPEQDLEKIINDFIFSRINYCKVVFIGLSKKSTRQLHLIQNVAANVLTKTENQSVAIMVHNDPNKLKLLQST